MREPANGGWPESPTHRTAFRLQLGERSSRTDARRCAHTVRSSLCHCSGVLSPSQLFLYLRGYFSTSFSGIVTPSPLCYNKPGLFDEMEEPNMKLAETLQERADLNRRIEQLRYRLSNNVLVQEGEKPLRTPAALLEELESSFHPPGMAHCPHQSHQLRRQGRRPLPHRAHRPPRCALPAGGCLPPPGGGSQPKYPPRHPHRDQDRFPPSMSPPCSGRPMMPPASCAFWITPCRPPTGPPT